jgi:hypothetical protein
MTETHITYSLACIERGAAGLRPPHPHQIEIKKKIADTMMSLVSHSLPAIEIG